MASWISEQMLWRRIAEEEKVNKGQHEQQSFLWRKESPGKHTSNRFETRDQAWPEAPEHNGMEDGQIPQGWKNCSDKKHPGGELLSKVHRHNTVEDQIWEI